MESCSPEAERGSLTREHLTSITFKQKAKF